MICTEDWVAVEETHPVVGGGRVGGDQIWLKATTWGVGAVHCRNVTHRPQLTALWTRVHSSSLC